MHKSDTKMHYQFAIFETTMLTKSNIPFELLLTAIQFATLWLLFYKLYRQESKTKRILLVICMALFHPFEMIASGIFFPNANDNEVTASSCSVYNSCLIVGRRKKKRMHNGGLSLEHRFFC